MFKILGVVNTYGIIQFQNIQSNYSKQYSTSPKSNNLKHLILKQ